MKEKILSLTKGKFHYAPAKLQLSHSQLRFLVVSGKETSTVLTVSNSRGTKVKGMLVGGDWRFRFDSIFYGEKNEIEIVFDGRRCKASDTIKGELHLVTDVGQCDIPYQVDVVAPVLKDDKGEVSDYQTLQERFRSNPNQGLALALNPDFEDVFLYREENQQVMYHQLLTHNDKLQAMEEFFVANQKKDQVQFSVEQSLYEYTIGSEEIQDSIVLRVNTWGSQEIHVSTTSDFISLPQTKFHSEEFVGAITEIPFVVSGKKVGKGKRQAKILVESLFQTVQVVIVVRTTEEFPVQQRSHSKKYLWALMKCYLNYEIGNITREEYLRNLPLLRKELEDCNIPMMPTILGYINYALGEKDPLGEYLTMAAEQPVPDEQAPFEEVVAYLAALFIRSQATGSEYDRDMAVAEIKRYKDNGVEHWILLYMLRRVDPRYTTLPPQFQLKEINQYLDAGARSPFLYFDAVKNIKDDVTLIHELNPTTIRTIYWGMKENQFDKEFALTLGFLAEHIRAFSKSIFQCLVLQYERYQMEDTLHSICSMLIRCEKTDEQYFPWYQLGVEKQLRITELFEYYMYTMDKENPVAFPNSVISYFQFENHLNDRTKAFLFARIIQDWKDQPENYKNYSEMIREFTQKQLEAHRVNQYLGVLYENLVTTGNVKENVAEQLPYVMFKQLLTCANPYMDGVKVIHLERSMEEYYPLINGQAQVDIFTPNYQIYFVDKLGKYHIGTVDYQLTELTHLDNLAKNCFENGSTHPYIMLHLFSKISRQAKLRQQDAMICHMVQNERLLRGSYQGRNMYLLFEHYSKAKDMEMLSHVLSEMDISCMDAKYMGEIVGELVRQSMYEKAYKAVRRYGYLICEPEVMLSLAVWQIDLLEEREDTFLLRACYDLYQKNVSNEKTVGYLMTHYMDLSERLLDICMFAVEHQLMVPDDFLERLLGQVIFTDINPEPYYDIFLYYNENGVNRVLVKAFLSYVAYGYLVEKCRVTKEIQQLIEKDAAYGDSQVMLLALLKDYSERTTLSDKQKEFADLKICELSKDGILMKFMQHFAGRIPLPYAVENAVIVQHFADTKLPVNVLHGDEVYPMREVFNGVFVREFLLFHGEEMDVQIVEEETETKTGEIHLEAPQSAHGNSFLAVVNEMIDCQESADQQGLDQAENKYEDYVQLANKLFHPL